VVRGKNPVIWYVKRIVSLAKRALSLAKRALSLSKRAVFLAERHAYEAHEMNDIILYHTILFQSFSKCGMIGNDICGMIWNIII